MKALNLGCGNKKYPGSIGVDISNRYNPDVEHDLNVFPYPFESGEVNLCISDNVLEHLKSPIYTSYDYTGIRFRVDKRVFNENITSPNVFKNCWLR